MKSPQKWQPLKNRSPRAYFRNFTVSCWSDSAGMSAYVWKCLTGSPHICRIGASKSPSMGRFLDNSHLNVAYLRVLVQDPCCSSFAPPRCLRLSIVTFRKFPVSRTTRSCTSVSEQMTITHRMRRWVLWRSAYVTYGHGWLTESCY